MESFDDLRRMLESAADDSEGVADDLWRQTLGVRDDDRGLFSWAVGHINDNVLRDHDAFTRMYATLIWGFVVGRAYERLLSEEESSRPFSEPPSSGDHPSHGFPPSR